MLLLAHTATGAVIGQKIDSLFIVAILGFISHFVLDHVPHWNYSVPKNFTVRTFINILPDIIPSVLIYFVFISAFPDQWLSISVGVAGAILPDFLILSKYFKKLSVVFKPLNHFHERIQGHLPKSIEIPIGLFNQVLYLGILIVLFIIL